MALVTCPDCGFSISDLAPTCSHCGGSNGSRVAVVAAAPPLTSYTAPIAFDAKAPEIALPFFEVGVVKFAVMSIVTCGLYDLYWAYQQWTRIKARTSEILSPFWRAAFAHIWGFSLFRQIARDAAHHRVYVGWSSGSLGLSYLLIGALWRLPDPWWLVALLSFLPLIPVVQAIAEVHDTLAPDRDRNTRFRGANIVGLVVGGIFWLLVLAGLFVK
jgi:hypothetical protein